MGLMVSKQSTPRKGTETGKARPKSKVRRETIYTPQGDGNQNAVNQLKIILPKQSTPRKGTETFRDLTKKLYVMKQSTPRKGTETRSLPRHHPQPLETIYTPQGDGNRRIFFVYILK